MLNHWNLHSTLFILRLRIFDISIGYVLWKLSSSIFEFFEPSLYSLHFFQFHFIIIIIDIKNMMLLLPNIENILEYISYFLFWREYSPHSFIFNIFSTSLLFLLLLLLLTMMMWWECRRVWGKGKWGNYVRKPQKHFRLKRFHIHLNISQRHRSQQKAKASLYHIHW